MREGPQARTCSMYLKVKDAANHRHGRTVPHGGEVQRCKGLCAGYGCCSRVSFQHR